MSRTTVRPASGEDAAALVPLLEALGYPAGPDGVGARLPLLLDNPDATALVAVRDGGVVGLITAHSFTSIHAHAPIVWITTLVVAADARRAGVGGAMVGAVEDWARGRGATRVSLSTGLHRDDAHAFYQRSGYVASGTRFSRSL